MSLFKLRIQEFINRYEGDFYGPVHDAMDDYFDQKGEIKFASRKETEELATAIFKAVREHIASMDEDIRKEISSSDFPLAVERIVRLRIIEYLMEIKEREAYLEKELKAWEEDE